MPLTGHTLDQQCAWPVPVLGGGGQLVRRWGLRTRMAVSYVLVTVAAVVLVEGVVLGVLLPRILANSVRADRAAAVAARAGSDAKLLSQETASITARSPAETSADHLVQRLAHDSRLTALGMADPGVKVAGQEGQCRAAANVEALISVSGTVLASSDPGACSPGARLGFAARPGLADQGAAIMGGREILWTVSPVYALALKSNQKPGPQPSPTGSVSESPFPGKGAAPAQSPSKRILLPNQVIGGVYAAAPAPPGGISLAQLRPLLVTGGLVLALVIPVGTVFGLLSTRPVIRRIKRLADVTATVAGGDFQPRVQVSGGDEIGRLEDAFNRMTGQLSDAVDAERLRAGTDARQAERTRIARELHDSISQDLFSLSLLATGMRKALCGDQALRPELTAMERTSARAMREMQALLLELRPVALEDVGLVPAITELCHAYSARLAIKVTAELGEVSLGPVAEHGVLRIVQEALGNAARHGEPEKILVRLSQSDGSVTVEVRDDGRGFDPTGVAERHGMGLTLMRDRVTELGGDFQLDAAPGEGAAITVRLPDGQDSRL